MTNIIYKKICDQFLREYNEDISKNYTHATEVYILKSQIHIPNRIRYMQLRDRKINPLLRFDYEGHICVVRKHRYMADEFILMDGYHRISAINNGISIIKAVVLLER